MATRFTTYEHPTFDTSSVDWTDPVSVAEGKERFVRERLILTEVTAIFREQTSACYRREGVNHLENCKDVVEAYQRHLDRYSNPRKPLDNPFRRITELRLQQQAAKDE
ncbi:hypothetical protein CAOG_08042 [Capsaspora owczarzaki ATCC 30864]|uniref:Uncharacterized protein n=1 Tax=Capsaspora owczarzaki (strain ATCC 30864) TaxID=595528 RepID=A0A0D2WYG8_CAPO3|nr:hypothetical protein CAOG_08042 [Capsaspora owczarzaki ATCC 30864]KJE97983.1 hypothetical protein CAOG_008042 [Capsaspora owczarzaki ATCC 30864]|eukprot:XP_004342643.1 hypothetical protein CAOG_08042 [Capsaspora owczarzaki ATCC 30864]